jgi:anaerobic sulfite reductase subunit A
VEQIPEYLELIINRENLYRFLGRLYKLEVDQPLLDHIAGMRFPAKCEDEELSAGYRMMEEYLHRSEQNPRTELSEDYARIFGGTGLAKGEAAHPYESIYSSPERVIVQEVRDRVAAVYDAKGLQKADALDLPEDHIALELEFMAYLCTEAQNFFSSKNRGALAACLIEQKEFLAQHLLNWVPAFCADIQDYAGTDFYKAVAKITNGFLRLEKGIVDDLVDETVVKTD